MPVIQWFPGHMKKTLDAIKKILPDIDIVIEILDARIPVSSSNPLLSKLISTKKTIKILNKSDLGDDVINNEWVKYLKNQNIKSLLINKNTKNIKKIIVNLCRSIIINRNSFERPLRVLIIGIPNVGKSTLINKIIGNAKLKVADLPGVTRMINCVKLFDNFLIYDTPGLTWEKFANESIANNLALCNSIGRNALEEQLLAIYLLKFLKAHYLNSVVNRYGLNIDNSVEVLIDLIARKRGCITKNGAVDVQKVSELIIHDYRNGKLGKISFEIPPNKNSS